MDIHILAEFVPFGETYAKAHPYASLVESFDELDLSSFAPTLRNPWFSSGNKPAPYQLLNSTSHETEDSSLPLNEDNYDEELYISGSTVIWSQNNVLKRSFEFRDERQPVLHALFAWFTLDEDGLKYGDKKDIGRGPWEHAIQEILSEKAKSPLRSQPGITAENVPRKERLHKALCVLLRDVARIYFINGKSHIVNLPFVVHKAWALSSGGLLLQRVPEYEELYHPLHDNSQQPPLDNLPVLFSLLDPFQEIAMVSLTEKISVFGSQVSVAEPTKAFSDWNHEIRFVHEGSYNRNRNKTSIIVTFNRQTRSHHIFRYATKVHHYDNIRRHTSIPLRLLTAPPNTSTGTPNYSINISSPTTQSPINRRSSLTRSDSNLTWDRLPYTDTADTPTIGGDNKMKSVTFMEHLWMEEEKTNNPESPSKIFIAHGMIGEEILCIFKKLEGTLAGYKISSENAAIKISNIFRFQAVSAVQISATRPSLSDILILKHDGSIALWTGNDQLMQCEIPPFNFETKCKISPTGQQRKSWVGADLLSTRARPAETSSQLESQSLTRPIIIELKDTVYNRVNLALANGMVFRAILQFIPTTNITKASLKALQYAMPSAEYFYFKTCFLEYNFGNRAKYKSFEPGDEWENFAVTLLSFCYSSLDDTIDILADIRSQDNLDEDLEFLMASTHHHIARKDPALRGLKSIESSRIPPNFTVCQWHEKAKKLFRIRRKQFDIHMHMHSVLFALHLVCEDWKLNSVTQHMVKAMIPLLVQLSKFVGWENWADFYARNSDDISNIMAVDGFQAASEQDFVTYQYSPPDIFYWLYDRLRQRTASDFPTVYDIPALFSFACEAALQERTCCKQTRKICALYTALHNTNRGPEAVVLQMVRENVTLQNLDSIPLGVVLPLREAIRRCRKFPSSNWPVEAYLLIQREDLAEQAAGIPSSTLAFGLDGDMKLKEQPSDYHSIAQSAVPVGAPSKKLDGAEITNREITDLRFGIDMRIKEVQRMLDSSNITKLRMAERPELNENALATEQLIQVRNLSNRTLALPIGRGILTFGTSIPVLTERLPIPGIILLVRMMPFNTVHNMKDNLLPEEMDWPDFHDGVAAGLRISSCASEVNGSWITYNKPEDMNAQHAGFLLAMGLTGHSRSMPSYQCYNYLAQKHDFVSVGLLLGLASAYCGTMDAMVTRLLSIHIPALLPPSATDLYHSTMTQTACVLGIGLLYMGTSHRRMAEVMLSEIGRGDVAPTDAANMQRESYSLASGLALGCITLGRGNESLGLADMHIVDELCQYMMGTMEAKGKSYLAPMTYGESSKPPQIISIDITSPGSTIALGLMYLKTGNNTIAQKLTIPDTVHLLDYTRPDFLLLRIICRNLIMWNNIQPTRQWIDNQVPSFMTRIMMKAKSRDSDRNIESVKQAYYSIVAGACFSMGLRYAGSANQQAFECLLYHLDIFAPLSTQAATTFEEKLSRTTMRSCLDIVATSVAMIMAGTGNLEVLKRLRKLYGRVNSDITYGNHIACSMAIGLLFLGAGNYTLGTSNKAIAALVCSFFPRFPITVTDNRTHLQAFRHLWVLAVEPRCLVFRDVDTRKVSYVPLTLTIYDENISPSIPMRQRPTRTITLVAPCLLPDFRTIKLISIDSPRYWPITLNIEDNFLHARRLFETRTIFVKRRTGHLTYEDDPKGFRSIFSRSLPKSLQSLDEGPNRRQLRGNDDFIKSFSADPQVDAFASYFCRSAIDNHQSYALASFCKSVLYECLIMNKPEAVQIYLALYQMQENLKISPDVMSLWNVKLILAYYDSDVASIPSRDPDDDQPLIQEAFITSFRQQMDDTFQSLEDEQFDALLLHYYTHFRFPTGNAIPSKLAWLGLYLSYNDIPTPDILRSLYRLIQNSLLEVAQEGTEAIGTILRVALPELSLKIVAKIQHIMCTHLKHTYS